MEIGRRLDYSLFTFRLHEVHVMNQLIFADESTNLMLPFGLMIHPVSCDLSES